MILVLDFPQKILYEPYAPLTNRRSLLCPCRMPWQVLCVVLAFVPLATGLSCYSCYENSVTRDTCAANAYIKDCSGSILENACVTIALTLEYSRMSLTVMNTTCLSSYACNDPGLICSAANTSLANTGITIRHCSVSCCYQNLCNGVGIQIGKVLTGTISFEVGQVG